MAEDEPERVLELVAGEVVQCILARADEEPRSAEALAEACDASLPTVYRRLNALAAHDLVHSETRIDPEGNHYETYETAVSRVVLDVGDGDVAVEVDRSADMVDRFRSFWSDLERESGPDDG